LTEAYNNLAEDVVAGLANGRRLRRRRLAVTYVENSAEIASITDMARCPMGTPEGTLCQMVIASYKVAIEDEDPQTVAQDYGMATDVAINMGELQEELNMINSNSDISVVEVVPDTPTSAPTGPPSDDGLSNGAIAGISVAGATVLLAGIGAGAYFGMKRRREPPKKPLGGDVDLDSVDSGGFGGGVGSMRPSSQANQPSVGAAATEPDYGEEDDDYSFQSGSFYEDSNSTFQSPVSQAGTTVSQIENYKFDDPNERKPYAAAAVGAAAAKQYESSSNAGSSGWSSSEEDTDYSDTGSSYSSARSDMEESNDSFFNNKNPAADSRQQFFDDQPKVTSARPESDGSGSYSNSTDSSDFTPQPSTPPESDRAAVPVPVPIPMPSRSDEESSESYTSSDNSSYDESTFDTSIPSAALHDASTSGTGDRKSSRGSRSYESSQELQGSMNERATQLESLVEKEDWDGVIASAQQLEADTEAANTPSTHGSRKLGDSSSTSISSSTSGSISGSSYTSSGSESESSSGSQSRSFETSGETKTSGSTDYTGTSATSETPEEARRRAEYRAEVEALVRLVVPEEIDNVDVMMVQFRGREAELVSTLRNMQERSVAQRARAAVHKSRGQPPRRDPVPGQYRKDGNYSTDSRMSERTDDTHGSAAGSAAIAAASVPRPAAGGRVPIHPPPVPAHESTQLESLGSSSTPPSAESTSASGTSYTTSGSRTTTDQSRSTSASRSSATRGAESYDSRTRGSESRSSSSGSSSGSYSGSSYSGSSGSSSGSSGSSSGSYSEDEQYTSQGTGTNYETSQGTSYGTSTFGESTVSEEEHVMQQRRPTQRRTSIKPWLTGDDDTNPDLDDSDLGMSLGGDYLRK
jgi:hypothetical protein